MKGIITCTWKVKSVKNKRCVAVSQLLIATLVMVSAPDLGERRCQFYSAGLHITYGDENIRKCIHYRHKHAQCHSNRFWLLLLQVYKKIIKYYIAVPTCTYLRQSCHVLVSVSVRHISACLLRPWPCPPASVYSPLCQDSHTCERGGGTFLVHVQVL